MKGKSAAGILLLMLTVFLASCSEQDAVKTSGQQNRPENGYRDVIEAAESSSTEAAVSHDFDPEAQVLANPYYYLSVPTYITKIGAEYFIVDCYNDQIIFNDNLDDPLTAWSVMTNDVKQAHTIAGDGTVYLIDDTENHRILVMERRVNNHGQPLFILTQAFTEVGDRPHYIVYHEATETFYAWSSMSGRMLLFSRNADDNTVSISGDYVMPSLVGIYVRSFTIIDDAIYFVSGNSSILKADLKTFAIIEAYPVPQQLAGMIQITLIEDYYYLTISTDADGNQDFATIIRTESLAGLKDNHYEDIYAYFVGGGTPYNMTAIEGYWFLTEHRVPGHSIWRFTVENNEIEDVTLIY